MNIGGSMPYQNVLKALVDRTPHSVGAILVDWEGEAVQEYCHCDPYDIRFVAAHKGIILARLKELHDSGRVGAVEDVVITTTDGHLIIGCIDQDYSLVVSVGRNCPRALALYHFRGAIAELRKEI
jgi:predicted regulator of Ras-like GTPase activity (Roadblock/LC7/MglB family)